MAAGGWFGRYLRIDAATGEAREVPIPLGVLRGLIGGAGLGAFILERETPPGFDPLGPAAAIVFAFGPLGGTPLTTSAKVAVVSKSPLTRRLNDALTSSDFALSGKRCGFDALVVTGAAPAPSVLLIEGDRARLEPAAGLWGSGLGLPAADAALRARHPGFDFAVVGEAGERGVRFAGLGNGGRHAGRGGSGAVLASKRLKAVGVRGAGVVPIADAAATLAIARDLAARSLGPATEKYRELGTVANLAAFNRLAALPTRNFQAGTFEGAAALSGEQLHATRARGRGSCRACTIGCEHFFEIAPGRGATKVEYESVFAFGPLCGVSEPADVLAAARACDELGMDTISAGGTIAFAMECAERGLFPPGPLADEARGLRFGDGARLLALLGDIAHRRGALGDLLAEGSRAVAERLGPPAPSFAPHVKGLEIPGYEPRALQTMALGFAVGSRGADHNRSGAYEADLSGRVDRLAPGPEAARLAVEAEDRAALLDSLILCKFLRRALGPDGAASGPKPRAPDRALGPDGDPFAAGAAMLEAVTGERLDAAELRAAAARIVLLKRRFNEREGWSVAEDTLPDRFFDEPLPGGVAQGAFTSRERFASLRAAYYEARGLGPEGRLAAGALGAAVEPP